jgi:hypothetical protein
VVSDACSFTLKAAVSLRNVARSRVVRAPLNRQEFPPLDATCASLGAGLPFAIVYSDEVSKTEPIG